MNLSKKLHHQLPRALPFQLNQNKLMKPCFQFLRAINFVETVKFFWSFPLLLVLLKKQNQAFDFH